MLGQLEGRGGRGGGGLISRFRGHAQSRGRGERMMIAREEGGRADEGWRFHKVPAVNASAPTPQLKTYCNILLKRNIFPPKNRFYS